MEQSCISGTVQLHGAKNAVLVIMASLILTRGRSQLTNVPNSSDVLQMIQLLEDLGAIVSFDAATSVLDVDTTGIDKVKVKPDIMKKMRASILVMGPLLARFAKADIALPGGCLIGTRPIDYHLKNFKKLGVVVETDGDFLHAHAPALEAQRIVLDYPSVGATENVMMLAALMEGTTRIINAAIEPEVLDLITVLKKMGARITVLPPATIEIEGVTSLGPVQHHVMYDRLEAGTVLLAAAVTGGTVCLPDAPAHDMDLFLYKLQEMGHVVEIGRSGRGVTLKAVSNPRAVSFKTGPHPSFPTDLQAPMMVAQCLAEGTSVIEETVFENRLLHVRELQKMGAQVSVEGNKAIVKGVEELYGAQVIATDIRASAALMIAGLAATGTTIMTGTHHFKRGYAALEKKLADVGARVTLTTEQESMTLVENFQKDRLTLG